MDREPTTGTVERGLGARVGRVAAGDEKLSALIERLLDVSRRGLPGMFLEGDRTYAHTVRLQDGGTVDREGTSPRYGAIVLLGARHLPTEDQRPLFGGETAEEFCSRLLASNLTNPGDIALVAWAAAEMGHPEAREALERVRRSTAELAEGFTVELAWALSAFAAGRDVLPLEAEARVICERLLGIFPAASGIFPHTYGGGATLRDHVACFADQVYPIQAFARHHLAYGEPRALEAANRCAQQICDLQGDAGQWWWHYDHRTGKVIEGYPVYSVHQDSMAPMALLDLQEAGGDDHGDAIRLGLAWMEVASEVGVSLIDDDRRVIWRKVARREPRKLMRAMRAGFSKVHSDLRVGALDCVFPPTEIEHESRPYHLGWVLFTWLTQL